MRKLLVIIAAASVVLALAGVSRSKRCDVVGPPDVHPDRDL